VEWDTEFTELGHGEYGRPAREQTMLRECVHKVCDCFTPDRFRSYFFRGLRGENSGRFHPPSSEERFPFSLGFRAMTRLWMIEETALR
jgi:hypothetical protein